MPCARPTFVALWHAVCMPHVRCLVAWRVHMLVGIMRCCAWNASETSKLLILYCTPGHGRDGELGPRDLPRGRPHDRRGQQYRVLHSSNLVDLAPVQVVLFSPAPGPRMRGSGCQSCVVCGAQACCGSGSIWHGCVMAPSACPCRGRTTGVTRL